jgi:hypothetical protein
MEVFLPGKIKTKYAASTEGFTTESLGVRDAKVLASFA